MALKILLADDSMTAQNMGKKILTEGGYEVVAVSNGAAAFKRISSDKPDLAILDVYMPGYTGLEVCDKIKRAPETAKIPVLLTVGKMEPFKPEDGSRVRADGLMIKPFEASDLLAVVQKIEQKLKSPKEDPNRTVRLEKPPDLTAHPSHDELMPHEEPEEAPAPKPMEMSAEMSAAPAMMDMGEPPPVGGTAEFAIAPPTPGEVPAYAVPDYGVHAEAPVNAPLLEVPPVEVATVSAPAAPTPAAHPLVEHGHGELELTPEPTRGDAHITQDPALVTDLNDIATQFVTKFGVENPEEISVGYAAAAEGAVAEALAASASTESAAEVEVLHNVAETHAAPHTEVLAAPEVAEAHVPEAVAHAAAEAPSVQPEELERTQRIEVYRDSSPAPSVVEPAPASAFDHTVRMEAPPVLEPPAVETHLVAEPEPAVVEPPQPVYPRTEKIEKYEEEPPPPVEAAPAAPAEPEVVAAAEPVPPAAVPRHEVAMSMVADVPEHRTPVAEVEPQVIEPHEAAPTPEPEPVIPPAEQRIQVSFGPDTYGAHEIVEPPPVVEEEHQAVEPEPEHEAAAEPAPIPAAPAPVAAHEDHLVKAFVQELDTAARSAPEIHEASHLAEAASAAAAAVVPGAVAAISAHPPAVTRIDVDAVANAVDRVLEDLKPELIARIVREMRQH